MIQLTKEDLLEAGFVLADDPLISYQYDLGGKMEEGGEGDPPILTFSIQYGSFCIVCPWGYITYFNADSPKEAVEWASKITMFEPPY